MSEDRQSMVGRVNVYLCETCRFATVTVHRDHGVTPFIIPCQHQGCGKRSYSTLYRAPTHLAPTHEWYLPITSEIATLDPMTRAHVEKGGLLLRPIDATTAPKGVLPFKQMAAATKENRTAAELSAEWEKVKRDTIKRYEDKLAALQKQPPGGIASLPDDLRKEAKP